MGLYNYQNRVRDTMLSGQSIILQAPTGAGKTRAALTPFLDTFWDAPSGTFPRKCIYIVPMRVLANQFTEELREESARYQRVFRRNLDVGRQTGEHREDPEFQKELTFATIDQVLSSWLIRPYSLSVRQGNLNAGAFVGSYLIFDEFHLFDPDSTLPTTLHMLKMLKGISPFLLMTATFSGDMLHDLAHELGAKDILLSEDELQDIPSQKKERHFHTVDRPLVSDEDIYIDQIVSAHLAQEFDDQRSLVVCNQVERAQRLFQALAQHKDLAGVTVRLLHSRFLREDRQRREAEVRQEFHKEKEKHTVRSMILVGTQVVEVGLDMSCRALHSELAPAAAILQRAGRCARYEGEIGNVYVYQVDQNQLHPYHEKEAKQQCVLTWEWLKTHESQQLDFRLEQQLINHAHTPTDKKLLEGLRGTELGHRERVYALWRGDGTRADAANLIRNIQAVTVVVNSEPDQLRHAPFHAESFSLHPGTLQGKFKTWKDKNESLDPDWDRGRLPWLVQKLVETGDEADTQSNRPIQYEFKSVAHAHELSAPLVVINPALVGYSPELGLTLYPTEHYECKVPQLMQSQREKYGYRLESYERHIQLVHQVYSSDWQEWIAAVGKRIETAYDWQPGIVSAMAELVVCLHDVGKLSEGWQQWACDWQAAIGIPLPHGIAVAHTDYDPTNELHKALERKMGRKRPNHAVESAYAVIPILLSMLPDKDKHRPLFRAAFTAISRHHAAFTSRPDSYRLIGGYEQHITETMALLPESLQSIDIAGMWQQLVYDDKAQRGIDTSLLVQSDNEPDMVCYMALVRALRFADQQGTKLGNH
ncbi:putative CRISPR-associated helicase Cas3 [Candidatus Promineifilum breve]|uniref:CRISPR-associated helicase Cas3 n=1 Tax=Candidatus Promineifilum breve TaxID=1806508 RepID=A0A160T2H7_9CHLR|nr:CRISPR-associated helicase Cas3' [Candidatus Promineifilum breve]CUS04321.2 putative CRISPR-associated helicase Cas3 [Candidatus Promineifilum breve]